jgi:hypothetical protein
VGPKPSWFTPRGDSDADLREHKRYLDEQMERIKSMRVCKPALASPEVRELASLKRQAAPLIWLEENLHVDLESDFILSLSMRDGSPDEQATLLNAVTKCYLEVWAEDQDRLKTSRLKSLDTAYQRSREELAAKRKSLLEAEKQPSEGDRAARLRDEIAIKEETCRRFLRAIEETNLESELPRRVDWLDRAQVPQAG